jgi:hypothetical protein
MRPTDPQVKLKSSAFFKITHQKFLKNGLNYRTQYASILHISITPCHTKKTQTNKQTKSLKTLYDQTFSHNHFSKYFKMTLFFLGKKTKWSQTFLATTHA